MPVYISLMKFYNAFQSRETKFSNKFDILILNRLQIESTVCWNKRILSRPFFIDMLVIVFYLKAVLINQEVLIKDLTKKSSPAQVKSGIYLLESISRTR